MEENVETTSYSTLIAQTLLQWPRGLMDVDQSVITDNSCLPATLPVPLYLELEISLFQ